MVLSAVVRITSNAHAFRMPSAVDEAFGFCDDLLGQPHCRLVELGERHWDIFRRLCAPVLAGRGADLIVIDDPLKPEEACRYYPPPGNSTNARPPKFPILAEPARSVRTVLAAVALASCRR